MNPQPTKEPPSVMSPALWSAIGHFASVNHGQGCQCTPCKRARALILQAGLWRFAYS